MRVLVTGGGGFIGCHLVESQLAQGHEVRAADLDLKALEPRSGHPRLERIKVDINDQDAVRALVDGVDVVYHLASVHLDVTRPDEVYRRVNVEGTANLVEAASAAGVRRFVHCSSAGVFGDRKVPPAADEQSDCNPTHIYEQSKLDGERAAIEVARRRGVFLVVARPAWVYGPGCPRTVKLLRMAGSGRFVMFGSGRTLRQPIYVADVVRGLERCAEADVVPLEVYLLAGESAVTIADLVRLVGDAQGVSTTILRLPAAVGHLVGTALQVACTPLRRQPPFSRRSMDFFLKDNLYDVTKASRQLGFTAEIGLQEGLAQTVAQLNGTLRGEHAEPASPLLPLAIGAAQVNVKEGVLARRAAGSAAALPPQSDAVTGQRRSPAGRNAAASQATPELVYLAEPAYDQGSIPARRLAAGAGSAEPT
jgi:nucleoside-diphosphate-sugar epimerase